MSKTVRTRIAPSPTGNPHIGTIYQVLFDYAVAKKADGKFILRLEDTDRARLVEGAEEGLYSSLEWFGLNPDESPKIGGPFSPYRQSERLDIYRPYAEQLIEQGNAYYCFCTKERLEEMRKQQEVAHKPPMYDKRCRYLSVDEVKKNLEDGVEHVIRMKIPEGETISFDDVLSGTIEFKSDVIDEQVILKSDGYPTYHLGVVVDDHLMEITHILRGKEWISSTPKHVLLYRYFGWEMPTHAHLPLILNGDGKGKLSKRHGHSSVDYYRKLGYLPEAILNYMSLIVWNHPEGKEIYSLDEFIRLFEIADITSQGPRFDLKKLDWVNGEYIRAMNNNELISRLKPYSKYSEGQIRSVIDLIKERLVKLSDFDSYVLFFFEKIPTVLKTDLEQLITEGRASFEKGVDDYFKSMLLGRVKSESEVAAMLGLAQESLQLIDSENWSHSLLEQDMRGLLEREGWKIGDFFMVLRVALTGRTATPPLFESMEVIGKHETIQRIQDAIKLLI
jgi:glutamyl-tRNA synthetase